MPYGPVSVCTPLIRHGMGIAASEVPCNGSAIAENPLVQSCKLRFLRVAPA